MTRRNLTVAAGLSGVALVAVGCSSSSTPADSVTVTATPTEATAAAPTPTAAKTNSGSGGATLPKPPAGSTKVGGSSNGAEQYARYKNSQKSPQKIVNSYKKKAQQTGYTIKNSGGSGGGWGGYGGSNYGLTAEKSGSYLDVQAGGENSGPTYFEVCVGPDNGAREHCENSSQEDSRSNAS